MTSSLKKIGHDASVWGQSTFQVPFEAFSECIKLCPKISKENQIILIFLLEDCSFPA